MSLDIVTHKTILFQLLKSIYTDTKIAPLLGFKGGTAALMFYGLDRFSVDLDFDLLDLSKADLIFEHLVTIAEKYGQVKESTRKRFSLFCLLSYADRKRTIKIEVNQRQFDSKYQLMTYLGVSMLVMVPEDMVAHKLMAMYERLGKTSRDLYDVWFFLHHHFGINRDIIERRSKMPFSKFLESSIDRLEHLANRNILLGVGELLTSNQKEWARANLLKETLALLKLQAEGHNETV